MCLLITSFVNHLNIYTYIHIYNNGTQQKCFNKLILNIFAGKASSICVTIIIITKKFIYKVIKENQLIDIIKKISFN